jgi:hypothetical protein
LADSVKRHPATLADGGGQADEATEQPATPARNQKRSTPPSATIFDRPAPPFSTAVNRRICSARRGLLLMIKSQQDTPPFSFSSTEHDFRL